MRRQLPLSMIVILKKQKNRAFERGFFVDEICLINIMKCIIKLFIV